jgi:hypothetical protein
MSPAINYEALRQELITTFDLSGLTDEQQNDLLEKMSEALAKRVFLETMEKLGEEGMKEYERLTERGATSEEIGLFLEEKIVGYTVFVQDIVNDFKHSLREQL